MHEFSFQFDREFLRAGLQRAHAWHAIRLLVVVTLMAIVVLYLVGRGFDLLQDPAIQLACAAGLLSIAAAAGYRYQSSVQSTWSAWTQQAPQGTVRYAADQDGFHLTLGTERMSVPWEEVRRLFRYRDVWILDTREHGYLLLPATAPEELRRFVRARCPGG